jgi:hypothetical protein
MSAWVSVALLSLLLLAGVADWLRSFRRRETTP